MSLCMDLDSSSPGAERCHHKVYVLKLAKLQVEVLASMLREG